MSTQTIDRVEVDPTTGAGRVSHIVMESPDKTAQALVLESLVEGTEVVALCGHRWVPSRDPKQFPVCQACEQIYRDRHGDDEGLPDA
jgi:hypothetical protein